MELFSSLYRPSWSSVCGGSDVKGVMELMDTTYRPLPEAHGICTAEDLEALERHMVRGDGSRDGHDDTNLYYPRVILNNEEMCCAGDDCDQCEGELWADGETPKLVQVVVSGVDWETSGCGEADPNGSYTLTQVAPCIWAVSSGIFYIYYQAYSQQPCTGSGQSSCVHVYSNTLVGADANRWYFRNCHDACGRDHGNTYYNFNLTANECCGLAWNGGCDFLGTLMPNAAFGGQAEVSWPV